MKNDVLIPRQNIGSAKKRKPKPIRIEWDESGAPYAEFSLTKGLTAKADLADLPVLAAFRWGASLSPSGKIVYAKAAGADGKAVYMHRLVLPKAGEVDHLDSDGLNNRRSNLQSVTHAENCWTARRKVASSGFHGVHKHVCKGHQYWRVTITNNGTKHEVGLFKNPEDAAKAYDAKLLELRGARAKLNFPQGFHTAAPTIENRPVLSTTAVNPHNITLGSSNVQSTTYVVRKGE